MSETDLHQWHRLAPIALVFLILNGLQKFVRENLYVFVGAGAGFAFTDWLGGRELLLAGTAVVLMLSFGAVVYHRRFRYRLEDDAVRVRKGLWVQQELRVRFDRVQNIQISRPVYYRPFGLVRFSLETPGAAEKEVELPGIPESLAEQIRDRISRQLAGEVIASSSQTDNEPTLHRPGIGRLFAHGVSSNQIWVLAGAFAYLYSVFRKRIEEWLGDVAAIQWLFEQLLASWYLIPVALLAVVGLLQGLSGVIAIVRFHDFVLSDRGDRVVASGGLLDRREKTARLEKITGVVAAQSLTGRLIDCWHLIVRQASSSEMDSVAGHQKQFLLPGLKRVDLSLIGRLLPATGGIPEFNPISVGFRRIFWIRIFVLMVAGLATLVALLGRGHPVVLLLAAAIPMALAGIHIRWRHWGWAMDRDMLWVRQGLFGQRIDVVPLSLVQQVRVGQSPYQFRRELANLDLTLPQGNLTVPFLDHEVAAELANRAALAAETALRHRI